MDGESEREPLVVKHDYKGLKYVCVLVSTLLSSRLGNGVKARGALIFPLDLAPANCLQTAHIKPEG